MSMTYPSQRQVINNFIPVSQILIQWPYLDNWRFALQHFHRLTGLEPQAPVRSAVCTESLKIYEFFDSGKTFNNNPALVKLLNEVRVAVAIHRNGETLMNSFLLMIIAYFMRVLSQLWHFLRYSMVSKYSCSNYNCLVFMCRNQNSSSVYLSNIPKHIVFDRVDKFKSFWWMWHY